VKDSSKKPSKNRFFPTLFQRYLLITREEQKVLFVLVLLFWFGLCVSLLWSPSFQSSSATVVVEKSEDD
jgi:hypothetical protein